MPQDNTPENIVSKEENINTETEVSDSAGKPGEKPGDNPKKVRTAKRILLIAGIIVGAVLIHRIILNSICCLILRNYINTFEAVDYSKETRKIPEIDTDTGHYSISTVGGLKVMMLNDFHIGGGPYTANVDKKTIYEVITMLQAVKPDLVILAGDNVFATPGPVFNGGGTFNNAMVERIVMHIFEHEQVYYSITFGNHDTEGFDFTLRKQLGKLFESGKSAGGTNDYCIFISEFSDSANDMPSVSNQFIELTDKDGRIQKLLLLIDSNDYVDRSVISSIKHRYDVIHNTQIQWAARVIANLSNKEGYADGEYIDTISFFHIPIGEFQTAYLDLEANGFKDTENTKYISGVWNEETDSELNTRIWFGGCSRFSENPDSADNFFEQFGPDGMNCLEAIFCGHDHFNSGSVVYKGVSLVYGMSLDNTVYTDIANSGLQRGCLLITFDEDGQMTWEHKNAYLDLGVETDKFMEVYLDRYYNTDYAPK